MHAIVAEPALAFDLGPQRAAASGCRSRSDACLPVFSVRRRLNDVGDRLNVASFAEYGFLD